MVSDCKEINLTVMKQIDDDSRNLINSLCAEKLKLLNETKSLYHLLAEKEDQIIRISENYQKRWENVCGYLRAIEDQLHQNPAGNLTRPPLDNRIIGLAPQMDASFSASSYFTVTDTIESAFSSQRSSRESLVPAADWINATVSGIATEVVGGQGNHQISVRSLSRLNDNNGDKSSENGDDSSSDRPHSHCLENGNSNKHSAGNIGNNDLAVSEPQFRIPDVPSPTTKRPVKRSSTLKTVKPTVKDEKPQNPEKSISDFTEKGILNWLLNDVRLPKVLVEDIKLKNKLDGVCIDQMTEQKLCKIFGTSDKLIRKKVMLALEEIKSRENIPNSDLSQKDHLWVANVWLKKHLGLGHLSNAFLSRCIDGRLLKYIATSPREKELINLSTINYEHMSGLSILPLNFINKNPSEPSKSDMRSIKYALELMVKFNFDLDELERRRTACENNNNDVLVWTNERVAKWFCKMNLKTYIRGIEYSGIHGGIMVLDPQFSMQTMSKLLQIPTEVVKKNNLDDKFSSLLKPSRFNEGVKNRRSTSIFRRRSLSQPRYSKQTATRTYKMSAANADASDSASTNDNLDTFTLKASHKEKSQTIDFSGSTNQNFVRKYRKPNTEESVPYRQKLDSVDTPTNSVPSTIGGHAIKLPASKTALSAQITRKVTAQSATESENSEDL